MSDRRGEAIGAYRIRRAFPSELGVLRDIELAAARMLAGYAPESVLSETTARASFDAAQRAGLLWVAVLDDAPVGFAHLTRLEPASVHLEELDVHPDHGRRGIGRRLVSTVCSWASAVELKSVTLSTFREPPWNAPFYASLGFDVLPEAEWSPAMRRIVEDETRRGLDPAHRLIMRRWT